MRGVFWLKPGQLQALQKYSPKYRLKKYWPKLSQHHFAIASQLLGDPNLLAWSNLGFWKNTANYPIACAQLAEQVGLAARLKASDTLLDLGCGQGASLNYWASRFGIECITAFEIQPHCIARIQAAHLPQLKHIFQAAFDQLPLPVKHLNHAFDAVVCVDAAYHACLADFLAVNLAALKPQGRIAFTTLSKSSRWSQAGWFYQHLTLKLLNMAYVPAQNLRPQHDIIATLQQAGFTDIQLQVLNQEVFSGFAKYIQQLKPPKHLALATKTGWLKIKMTARLCHFLARHGLIHYVLVSARRV
jgi:cyclopropane fatty-acyl-phospholipid synthase-like methyltransferase